MEGSIGKSLGQGNTTNHVTAELLSILEDASRGLAEFVKVIGAIGS